MRRRITIETASDLDAGQVRTGFWGCGAFGGNREVMVILQRLAGVSRLRFYAFDDAGRDRFAAGSAVLDRGYPDCASTRSVRGPASWHRSVAVR